MDIIERKGASATVLDLDGSFDHEGCRAFITAVKKAQRKHCRHLILNLERVPCIDSAALGLIVIIYHGLRRLNCKISLLRPPAHVQAVLNEAGIHS